MDAETAKKREKLEALKPLLATLDQAMAGLEIYQPDQLDKKFDKELSIGTLRRSRKRQLEDPIGMIALTETDGVLQWEEGAGVMGMSGRRARRGGGFTPSGNILAQYKFEKLEPSKVGEYLTKLDDKLTPNQGLRRFMGSDDLRVVEKPAAKKRVLLFVHGTFSNNENLLKEVEMSEEGKAFLKRAAKDRYDEILTFDHPTLSVSPVLNALDLARRFADCKVPVDVICHSRGGLVTRWWLEGFKPPAGGDQKVVMVGVPLSGTSLAAPPRLRSALNLITNVGKALSVVSDSAALALPFFSVASGLFKVISSITNFGANTPLIDAAVAMIPGLSCQSRTGNNQELLRIRQAQGQANPNYFVVKSNFAAKDPGWKFWQRFVRWKENLADLGTDIVFEGENDLVVDTTSMTELSDSVNINTAGNIFDFGTTDRIHHTNYFRQPETMKFIGEKLGV